PLPESQLDRFTMSIKIGYPSGSVEKEIVKSPPGELLPGKLAPVVTSIEVLTMQDAVEEVRVEEDLLNYMVEIVSATRDRKSIRLGVSPRGTMAFFRSAQAMALVGGRDYCVPDDIKKVASPVLSHRIIPAQHVMEESYEEPSRIIEDIMEGISVPI
ncbi:MAG TPA: MoxR family ATPase, partial [Thermodesulfobacteriota bacterium]|nr:MoxR family ATPase [Thermodesulfobacteriota bacterium]